jgi:hypothetical protein
MRMASRVACLFENFLGGAVGLIQVAFIRRRVVFRHDLCVPSPLGLKYRFLSMCYSSQRLTGAGVAKLQISNGNLQSGLAKP